MFKIPRALLVGLTLGCTSLFADGSNALDRIDFGNAASEVAHKFKAYADPIRLPPPGVGALGQTYRQPLPLEGSNLPSNENDRLAFTLKVDPARQNYLTVKLWGGDQQTIGLWMNDTPKSYGAMDWNGTGGPPSFPERFYYTTLPIPIETTKGKTSVPLALYQNNAPVDMPGRPIYGAFTHVDPQFIPDRADPTGVQMPLTGYRAPETLKAERITGFLQANRKTIYGPGGYYDRMLSQQIMPGTKSAPPEVIGLDLCTTVADWNDGSRSHDDWRNQAGGHGHGGGYATMPDELLSVLTSTYLLPPFKAADGRVVEGLDHYHDAGIIPRIVSALDASTYLQSSDGSFNDQGWDNANNLSAQGRWQGLASTPRAAGQPYAGRKARGGGWSITLEGANTATFGWVILQLLNDPAASPIFKKALAQSFDADLNGLPMNRAQAYERMLNNQVSYQAKIFGGGTVAQALMAINSIYTNHVALTLLQSLSPYPSGTSSFPTGAALTPTDVSYPALPPGKALDFVRQGLGVEAVTPIMASLYGKEYINYAISKKGLGEVGGTRSGGYDGRYGVILPWMASRLTQVAAWDPGVDAVLLGKIRTQTQAAVDAYIRFVSPNEKFRGTTNLFTFAQEDFITYRDPYNANANGNTFTVGTRYVVSDPANGMSTPLSLRAAYLEALYEAPPSDLQYLRDLSAYENTMRVLAGVDPARIMPLPGEPDQPDSAWVDPQIGATAVHFRGDRFYLNANWRNGDIAGNGKVTHLARIHLTSAAVDLTALVFMPHDESTVQSDGNLSGSLYQPWVVRYGNYLVMGNPGERTATLKLPPGRRVALDLITKKTYPMGATVSVRAGEAAVMVFPEGGPGWNRPPMPGPEHTVPDGTYALMSAVSKLLLDAGDGLRQLPARAGGEQQWIFKFSPQGYTLENAASHQVLTDDDGLRLKPLSASDDRQRWRLVPNGIGYVLINVHTAQAVDDPASSKDAGTGIGSYVYGGGLNQIWALLAVSGRNTR